MRSDIIPLLAKGLGKFSMHIQNWSEWVEQRFNLGLVGHGLHWGHLEAHSLTVASSYVHTSPRDAWRNWNWRSRPL